MALASEPAPTPGAPSAAVMPLSAGARDKALTIAQLFEAEESRVLRFALGLVGRRSVAEELVQETFLRLHAVWEQVENPRAWLYRSLRNLALNHLRDNPPESELDENAPAGPGDPNGAADAPPVEILGRMEAVGMVRMLLAEMPEEDRVLIRLKYHENLKYRDIGRRTGLSVGNAGYRLHHLLKGLADALRRAGIEDSRG